MILNGNTEPFFTAETQRNAEEKIIMAKKTKKKMKRVCSPRICGEI